MKICEISKFKAGKKRLLKKIYGKYHVFDIFSYNEKFYNGDLNQYVFYIKFGYGRTKNDYKMIVHFYQKESTFDNPFQVFTYDLIRDGKHFKLRSFEYDTTYINSVQVPRNINIVLLDYIKNHFSIARMKKMLRVECGL